MYIYLFLQFFVSILLFLSLKFFYKKFILSLITILPILINAITVFIFKSEKKLKYALLFTLIADYFFMFKNNIQVGISFFIIVQTLYMYYIRDKKTNMIIIGILLINCLIMLMSTQRHVILEGSIYGILTIINLYICFKYSKKDEKINMMKKAIVLLFLCDFTLLIRKFIYFKPMVDLIIEYIQWMFYIPSQILVVLVATHKYNYIFRHHKNQN